MSHQTGIQANDSLMDFFGTCRSGKIRIFQVCIENESLVLSGSSESRGTWEQDFEALIQPLLKENASSYLFYRLDSENAMGYEWLLISWIPETSAVREKMLYASTKATLKNQFGSGQIKEELLATIPEELTLNGYKQYKRNAASSAPLTNAEEELALVKKAENNADVSVDSKHQTLSGIAFPLDEQAIRALVAIKAKTVNYVQLSIDLKKEIINLEMKENISVADLPKKVPTDQARYHLLRFPHSHEGDFLESVVFIYSMPGYNCSIRERMMYSSSKGPVTEMIEAAGIQIAKKIEVDSAEELTEEFIFDELHPKINLHQPKFAKPKGPPNRGARRMLKKDD